MEIILNGDEHTTAQGRTVSALLEELNVRGRVAVMINDRIVKRDRYGESRIQDGDRVEVIAMVGGG